MYKSSLNYLHVSFKSNYIMTKIYVVKAGRKGDNDSAIMAVFTNLRKAESYRDYYNLVMEDKLIYWIMKYDIENFDYSYSLENELKERGLE